MTSLKPVQVGILALALCTAKAAIAEQTQTPKARFAQAMKLLESDASAATSILETLCDEAYARGCDRLAFLTFKGRGVAQDSAKAIALYERAIKLGRASSLVSLGKTHLSLKQFEAAYRTLQSAMDQGIAKAEPVMAWANATGRLGGLSQRQTGLTDLLKLAREDQRTAQLYTMDAVARIKDRRPNIDDILDRLHQRHIEGDAKAAEALLRYYRIVDHDKGTIRMRATLLDTAGLRDKIRIEEGLYLARDQRPAQFWSASEDLVRSAPPDVFARALVVSAKININAYVRIVQKELRALGYPVGRPSPYMNRPLVRSINAFCADTGLGSACRQGPLKSATIKAVAAELSNARARS
ncbi:MAG: hypothetical protein MK098_13680 [Marinovum sp.]|nr:hypothetical protein [Marinovum sp.]